MDVSMVMHAWQMSGIRWVPRDGGVLEGFNESLSWVPVRCSALPCAVWLE